MSIIPAEVIPPVYPRRRQVLFGTGFAVAGIAMYFLTLIGMYLEVRHGHRATWLTNNNIPLTQPNVQFFTLVMSSVTMQWAVYSISRDDKSHAYWAIGITLLMGLAFLNQTTFLYKMVGLPLHSQEGPLFYAITGSHFAMVGAACIFLLLMGLRTVGGSFSSRYPDGLSAAALFWHATVAIYSVIWIGVYVAK